MWWKDFAKSAFSSNCCTASHPITTVVMEFERLQRFGDAELIHRQIALLVCAVVLGMVCADSISSLSQGSLMRYAVCAKVKVIRWVRVIKCAKRPTPLPDPTQNLQTVCAGVGAEFNSYEEAVRWMQVNCN